LQTSAELMKKFNSTQTILNDYQKKAEADRK